jgi:hypothetical protein
MSNPLPTSVKSASSESLHQLLLSFGKQWLPWLSAKNKVPLSRVRYVQVDASYDLGEALMLEQIRTATIGQLATSLRLQGIDDEANTMLTVLESLAHAGEISFTDYIGRVQNLFPRALETIDVSLRMKIMNAMAT